MNLRLLAALLLLLSVSSRLLGQHTAHNADPHTYHALTKKPLTPEALASDWKWIETPVLSDDGRWLAYSLTKWKGQSELIVRETTGKREYVVSRGSGDRPQALLPKSQHLVRAARPTSLPALQASSYSLVHNTAGLIGP
jgi:hypothetical protein